MKIKSNEEGKCPICNCEDLEYGDMTNVGGMLYYEWKCPHCGTEGEEWYDLKFSGHNIITENGDSIEIEKNENGEFKKINIRGGNNMKLKLSVKTYQIDADIFVAEYNEEEEKFEDIACLHYYWAGLEFENQEELKDKIKEDITQILQNAGYNLGDFDKSNIEDIELSINIAMQNLIK